MSSSTSLPNPSFISSPSLKRRLSIVDDPSTLKRLNLSTSPCPPDVTMASGDSDDEADALPRRKLDKGKGRARELPELPGEVWRQIFQVFNRTWQDGMSPLRRALTTAWDDGTSHTQTARSALTPLLISKELTAITVPLLYAHPHLSYNTIPKFLDSLEYPSRYTKAAKHVYVTSLTIKPVPNVPGTSSHPKGPVIMPNGRTGSSYTVHPQFSDVLRYFPDLTSFTLKDTLIHHHADAQRIFDGLVLIRPKKARLEIRMWNLYESPVGEDIMAVSRPSVFSTMLPPPPFDNNAMDGMGTRPHFTWRDALHEGYEWELPLGWGDVPGPTNNNAPPPAAHHPAPAPPMATANASGDVLQQATSLLASATAMQATVNYMTTAGGTSSWAPAPSGGPPASSRWRNAARVAAPVPPLRIRDQDHSDESDYDSAEDEDFFDDLLQSVFQPVRTTAAPPTPVHHTTPAAPPASSAHPFQEAEDNQTAPIAASPRLDQELMDKSEPAGEGSVASTSAPATVAPPLDHPDDAGQRHAEDRPPSARASRSTQDSSSLDRHAEYEREHHYSFLQREAQERRERIRRTYTSGNGERGRGGGSSASSSGMWDRGILSRSGVPPHPAARGQGLPPRWRLDANRSRVTATASPASSSQQTAPPQTAGRTSTVNGNSAPHAPVSTVTPSIPPPALGFSSNFRHQQNIATPLMPPEMAAYFTSEPGLTGAALSHQLRIMFRDLIMENWEGHIQALSLVALDPLASVIFRAPRLDLWTMLAIPHIRVHLPRGIHSLAVLKGAKQTSDDHARVRRDPNEPATPPHKIRIVGGDGNGGELLHDDIRLFEIEVNTMSEMRDEQWIQYGHQIPPQVCRILVGEQDWRSVHVGPSQYAATPPPGESTPVRSPLTDNFASPTFSFQSLDSDDEDEDVLGRSGGESEGDNYDSEAAEAQARMIAERQAARKRSTLVPE